MASIFDSYVTTATQDYILPMVTDSVLDWNVLASKLMWLNAWKFRWEQHKVNYRVWSSNAAATLWGWFRGTDTFSTQRQDETVQWAFNPKYVYEPINLVYTDLSLNKWKEEVLSIVKRDTEYAMSNLMDNIGTMFYSTNSDSSKWFTWLRNIIAESGTYGWLSRTTYTAINPGKTGQSGKTNGIDSATTALTLASMRTVWNALTSWAARPDLAMTTPAIFWFYEALLQPMQRMNLWGYAQVTKDWMAQNQASLWGATWFDALMYDGTAIVRDDKCNDDHLYVLNTKWLWFNKIDNFWDLWGWSSINFTPDVVQGQYSANPWEGLASWFAWSGWKEPTNQAAVSSQVVAAWELIATDPRRQGMFTAITS